MLSPFSLISWHEPFLPALKDLIAAHTHDRPGQALIIVPNKRPWRYFVELYRQDGNAAVLPRMLAFEDIISIWNAHSGTEPLIPANELDQAGLLWDIIRGMDGAKASLIRRFSSMDISGFLPWGMRLASLLEEYAEEGLEPRDLDYTEGSVEPLAARILEALGKIGHEWRTALAARGWTTRGQEMLKAAENAARLPPGLSPSAERDIYIAGFSRLSGVQKKLFRTMWESGAHICLHADPGLSHGRGHWACAHPARWIKEWGAEVSLIEANGSQEPPRFMFFSGYDGHSQLMQMKEDLKTPGGSEAVILADPQRLVPALYHLPRKDINISLGYPLSRTSLRVLLDELLALLLRKRPAGKFYWRDLKTFLSHPLLNRMHKRAQDGGEIGLAALTGRLIKLINKGEAFADLARLADECSASLESEEERGFLRVFTETFIYGPESAKTARQLAEALGLICDFLLDYGAGVWEDDPLDAEALARLRDVALATLRENALSDLELPAATLRMLLFALLESEHVPFEAFPLVGVQVLGFSESRLLQFDNLYIIDANEDLLPGMQGQDPLLPDSLRPAAGLPDSRQKQSEAAYNFYRLCQCAKNVWLYWQEGASTPSGGKKSRSRYVEQLLWEREREVWDKEPDQRDTGRILKTALVRPASITARLQRSQNRPLERTQAIDIRMKEILRSPLSPSLLETYLKCPKSFIYKNVLCLSEPEEVMEGQDALVTGSFLHDFLRDFFMPWRGRELKQSGIDRKAFLGRFRELLEEEKLAQKLTAASYIYFENAAPVLLKRFLDHSAESSIIRYLEDPVEAQLELCGGKYNFRGRPDRIDEREGCLYILDYKTGSIPKTAPEFWIDDDFYGELKQYSLENALYNEDADERLAALKDLLGDPQLHSYTLMLDQISAVPVGNAAFVDLRDSGREIFLWPQAADRTMLLERSANALGFILRHMEKAAAFTGNEASCKYCPYISICSG